MITPAAPTGRASAAFETSYGWGEVWHGEQSIFDATFWTWPFVPWQPGHAAVSWGMTNRAEAPPEIWLLS